MSKILIIDDEKSNLAIYQRILEESLPEHEVIVSTDSEQTIPLAVGNNVDGIVLDMMMPKINGWEVVKKIRETSYVPIILMSALSEEEDILKGSGKI